VGLLTIVTFTRLLTPAQFGDYALGFSVMSLTHTAVFTWNEAAMARFWAAEEGRDAGAAHSATVYGMWALLALALPVAGLVAWLWPLHEGALRVDAGVAGGLWYRTEHDGGPHRVVPAVMPALTITHTASGLGVNLGLAPRFTIAGRGNAVDALMLQTTLAF
jgi:hypothetical protein